MDTEREAEPNSASDAPEQHAQSQTKSAAKVNGKMDHIAVLGEARLRASVSMLYTEILSQEVNAAISTPQSIETLQKHLKNRTLDQLSQRDLLPLMDSIPEQILEVGKEIAFTSGAIVKRIPCTLPLEIGQGFIFRGSGLMAELEIKDGRVVEIRRLNKR